MSALPPQGMYPVTYAQVSTSIVCVFLKCSLHFQKRTEIWPKQKSAQYWGGWRFVSVQNMALVDALDGMSTCVSNGPEWLMLQLTFWWTIKNAAGFQATAARGVFKSALQPQGDGAALDADWSLTGVVWTSGLAFHPFLSLSRGNLRDFRPCSHPVSAKT